MTTFEYAPFHVSRIDGETVCLDLEWPRAVRFVEDLSMFDPQHVSRVGDLILVKVANGNATYRIVVEDRIRGELDCVLEDGELSPRGPF